MHLEKTPLGYEVRTPQVTVFLGGIHAQLPQLTEAYPQTRLVRIKQIHSDVVVHTSEDSPDYQVTADSHYTRDKGLGLCVITADCVPVFFYDHSTSLIAGVHAGWRGVVGKIIPKTIEALTKQGANPGNLNVIIGPHIQKSSFEVGHDVRDQILGSLGPVEKSEYSVSLSESKSLVDLNLVVRTQLQQAGINSDHLFNLHIDTVANTEFHSYRRDKEKSGRQVSFICRTA
jgi:YfiH family protein